MDKLFYLICFLVIAFVIILGYLIYAFVNNAEFAKTAGGDGQHQLKFIGMEVSGGLIVVVLALFILPILYLVDVLDSKKDPCLLNPDLIQCQDDTPPPNPCELNPHLPQCDEIPEPIDPCVRNPNLSQCPQPVDPCQIEPTFPECDRAGAHEHLTFSAFNATAANDSFFKTLGKKQYFYISNDKWLFVNHEGKKGDPTWFMPYWNANGEKRKAKLTADGKNFEVTDNEAWQNTTIQSAITYKVNWNKTKVLTPAEM